MKNKFKYIIASWLLIVGLSACTEKDLTLVPDGSEVATNFYKTPDQLKMALYAAYKPFQNQVWTGSTFMFGSIASDDAVAGGADQSDQLDFNLVDRYVLTAYTSKDQNNRQAYSNWYSMNTAANYIIKYASDQTTFGKNAIAQAYFLKGFACFMLTRMYGGIAIIDDVPGPNDKNPRASQEDTWKAIEGYLLKATAGDLVSRTGGVDPADGTATQQAALTLLGKVYLYEKKYNECISTLEKVAQDANYSLETNYGNIFNPANTHGKESIFEINFSRTNSPNTNGWDNLSASNTTYTLCGPRDGEALIPDPAPFEFGWGMNQPTKQLAAAFDAEQDTARKLHSIISSDSISWYFKNAGKTVTWQNELTGWWDLKHIRRKGFFSATNQVGQNTIVFRLADVYLMLAEAYSNTGDAVNTKKYMDLIRTRAKLATQASYTLQNIKDERRLELCLEGDRYYDLVRWGDAESTLVGEDYDTSPAKYSWATGTPGKKTNGLFPIPQQEMDRMKGVAGFDQNPGY